jgi:hypothetical protein
VPVGPVNSAFGYGAPGVEPVQVITGGQSIPQITRKFSVPAQPIVVPVIRHIALRSSARWAIAARANRMVKGSRHICPGPPYAYTVAIAFAGSSLIGRIERGANCITAVGIIECGIAPQLLIRGFLNANVTSR